MSGANLTAERLRELLHYSPETGVFTWRVGRSNVKAGSKAGSLNTEGALYINVDGRSLKASRLAWLYVHGALPAGKIRHLNNDGGDCHIANLRLCSSEEQRTLTRERAVQLFDYNPETGEFRRNIRVSGAKALADDCALDGAGYYRISVDGKKYAVHRLIWLIVHGHFPDGEIDHINGVRSDNRLANLRVVTKQGNVHNRHRSWASSGYMGVSKNGKGWRASININRRTISLGTYATKEEAHAAYLEAKRRLHPTSTLAQSATPAF